jgi:serine/threonine protein kinase/tetratricopeptide (TPR) repeat protein
VEKLGEGGVGVIYRAEDLKLKRYVALKFLASISNGDPGAKARFVREAEAAAALAHPNICTVYEIGEFQGQIFIAMECCEGETLKERIARGPLTIIEVVDIVRQVAHGLSKAHQQGIVHRDIKPANIFLTKDRLVKILDFGLAKQVDQTAITKTGATLGTPAYMSPEQSGGSTIDHRTDLWALGVLLYELLTGQLPFQGENQLALVSAISSTHPQRISNLRRGVPAELEEIVERLLEKVRGRRYANADALISALSKFGDTDHTAGETVTLDRPGSRFRLQRWQRRRLEFAIGGAISAAALVLVVLYVWPGFLKPGPEISSLAVLPFKNLSGDPEQEYFCDGIAEDIINDLTQVEGLNVVARTSAFAFKSQAKDVREIGNILNAGAVLEGSVRKAGNNLRISTQLVSVKDGYQLWAKRYDRELKDVFAIQEEIAQNIVQALKIELSEKEELVLKKTATVDVDAYDFYLRGRGFFHQHRRGHVDAIEMFSNAIGKDSGFALAYAAMADCYTDLYITQDKDIAHLERGITASNKALDLDPELAEAHVSRGFAISSLSRQYEDAEKEFEIGIRLNPRLFEAYYLYARSCRIQGKMEKAARLFEDACRVRPGDYQAMSFLASTYEALDLAAKAEDAHRESFVLMQRHLGQNPNDARALYLGANTLVKLGEREEGLEWAKRSLSIEPDNPLLIYNLACIFSLAGEIEMAIDYFERAIKSGYTNYAWVKTDMDLDPLRSHPRFQALIEKME